MDLQNIKSFEQFLQSGNIAPFDLISAILGKYYLTQFGHHDPLVDLAMQYSTGIDIPESSYDTVMRNLDILFDDDIIGTWYQHYLDSVTRKVTASNYTQDAISLIKDLAFDDINSIADPFCGSGRLITAFLKEFHAETVYINDIQEFPVLLAKLRIYHRFPDVSIHASINDAFGLEIPKVDLIIMNPPFTRAMHISDHTHSLIHKWIKADVSKHTGLHTYALFLADHLLNHRGYLFSVLPGSTFSSSYSKDFINVLLKKYDRIQLIQDNQKLSFSEDSEFNEVLLYAQKSRGDTDVQFREITTNTSLVIPKNDLKSEWNWIRYFRLSELHRFIKSMNLTLFGFDSSTIKRGIELYGPNFFFFPNKHITRVELIDEQVILNPGAFNLPSRMLLPILRQPKLYKETITPIINQYTLCVDRLASEEEGFIQNYVNSFIKEAEVAIKRFGEKWIHHIHHQISTKQPKGRLFLIDKLDILQTSTLIHYTDTDQYCTKNFYVVQLPNDIVKLLSAWMSSSLYLLLYLASRREINRSYGRLQIIDYINEKLIPSVIFSDQFDNQKELILNEFDKLRSKTLPTIPEQLDNKLKFELDKLFIQLLQLDCTVEKVYEVLIATLDSFRS
ncbi:MAG: methyltransferase [Candidatus Heimdallarchaeota archaeon]|nr:methyltransferase [Candidatus Heimdallarchaeota archaeon]